MLFPSKRIVHPTKRQAQGFARKSIGKSGWTGKGTKLVGVGVGDGAAGARKEAAGDAGPRQGFKLR